MTCDSTLRLRCRDELDGSEWMDGSRIDILESPPVLSLVPLKGVGSPTQE